MCCTFHPCWETRAQAAEFRLNGQHRIDILKRSTVEQLRNDIDHGRTCDKVDAPDFAAVPLGADDEAAGTPPDPCAIELARSIEASRSCAAPSHRGLGATWLLTALACAVVAGLVAWMLWSSS